MKNFRKISALFIALLMLSGFAFSAFAAEAKLDNVTDMADMFTQDQWAELENKAEALSEKYNIGVYILVLDDYKKYANSRDPWDAAMEIYNDQLLGCGNDKAGVLLMLSMAERDYALDFNTARADYVFTEAGRDRMEDRFLKYFRNNDFVGGFREYLNTCEEYLIAAENGSPVGQGEPSSADRMEEKSGLGIFTVVPGAIVAAITGLVMSSSMHTAVRQRDADTYVEGSLELRRRSDMFLHRSVTRVPRQTESSRSGGSGSVHHSSGSHSGRSGKF